MMEDQYPLVAIAGDHNEAVRAVESALLAMGNLLTDHESGQSIAWKTMAEAHDRLFALSQPLKDALAPLAAEIAEEQRRYDEDSDRWDAQYGSGT